MLGVVQDIKTELQSGNRLSQLIFINTVVFLYLLLMGMGLRTFGYAEQFNEVARFFEISTHARHNLLHPWAAVTYQFLHIDFWHFVFNMFTLWTFGQVLQVIFNRHIILPIYLVSGVFGFLVYWLGSYILPLSITNSIAPYALGASASVMGVAFAATALAPDYELHIGFLGAFKLKYIAIFFIILDLFNMSTGNNTGGHLAHLGGAVMGYFFIYQLRQGNDWSRFFYRYFNKLKFSRGSNLRAVPKPKPDTFATPHSVTDGDNVSQQVIDKILDKVKATGYASLTDREKEYLFKVSKTSDKTKK